MERYPAVAGERSESGEHAADTVATVHPRCDRGGRCPGSCRGRRGRGSAHEWATQRHHCDPGGTGIGDGQPGDQAAGRLCRKPTPDKLAATLALALAEPNLGILTGRITDAATGTQLWAQGADLPMQPASVTKVLTTSAALLGLDRDARLTTKVMASDRRPGLVVLKGGGDPTLSAVPAGGEPGTETRHGSATSPIRCGAAAPR